MKGESTAAVSNVTYTVRLKKGKVRKLWQWCIAALLPLSVCVHACACACVHALWEFITCKAGSIAREF